MIEVHIFAKHESQFILLYLKNGRLLSMRNKYVNYTKTQIQEKEGQLKRDYKLLKAARQQSGASWNEDRCMVEGSPSLWNNLEVTHGPKIKKFRNNKARFPLFDALGELYDGHLAEGNHNITSLESPQVDKPLHQIEDVEDESEDNIEIHELQDDHDDDDDVAAIDKWATQERSVHQEGECEVACAERSGQQRTTTSNKKQKEEKRPKKGGMVEEMMGRYLDMRTKQVQDESAELAKEKEDLAKEKEVAENNDFSIKKCITVLSQMDVTKEEKAKAFSIFIKSRESREAFLTGCEVDQDTTLIWLRNEMA